MSGTEDTESEHRYPFRNVTLDEDLEQNVNLLTSSASAFGIRLVRELLQLRRFKRYAMNEIGSLSRFRKENENVQREVRQMRKFQQSVSTHFRYIEDKINGVSDGQEAIPVGSDSSSQPIEVTPTSQRVQSDPSGDDVESDEPKASCGNNELASLVRTLFEKGALNVNESNGDDTTAAEVHELLTTVRVKVQSPGAHRFGITKRRQLPDVSRPVTTPVTAERGMKSEEPEKPETKSDRFDLTFDETLTQSPQTPPLN